MLKKGKFDILLALTKLFRSSNCGSGARLCRVKLLFPFRWLVWEGLPGIDIAHSWSLNCLTHCKISKTKVTVLETCILVFYFYMLRFLGFGGVTRLPT